MQRRTFLFGSLSAAALAGAGFYFKAGEDHELYSSFGDWGPAWIDQLEPSRPAHLVFFSPRTFASQVFAVPFRVHTGVQNPQRREHFVLISKWGDQICTFHRRSGEVASVLTLPAGRRFFGHGVWEDDGVWITENDDRTGQGFLTLRDPVTLEMRRQISSHGVYPHELKTPTPGVLQIANTGDFKNQAGNISWIQSRDGKLLHQLDFSDHRGVAGPSHFWQSDDLFIGSITADGEQPSVVWRVKENETPRVIQPREDQRDLYRGEVVSFAELDGSIMWTQAKTKAVFGVSGGPTATAEVKIPLFPHGMIRDGNHVFVTKGRSGEIVRWSPKEQTTGHGPILAQEKWGAHILRAEI